VQRYRIGGVEAIAKRSRKPLHSLRRTQPEWEQRVVEMRAALETWNVNYFPESHHFRCSMIGNTGLIAGKSSTIG
jgi:hypothetical protein